MHIYIYFLLFYLFFFRYFVPNPILAFIIFYVVYLLIDRQFVALPDAFKPFKTRTKIKRLKDELKVNPANVNAHYELGQIYLEQKKYQASIENLSQTIDKMGEYGEVYFYLGKAQYHKGEKEEGLRNLAKAVDIDHKVGYGEPYIYLLVEEIKKGNDPEKVEQLVASIHRFGSPEIFYKAGIYLKKLDKNMTRKMFHWALDSYSGTPRHFKRTHRRWAILARLQLLF